MVWQSYCKNNKGAIILPHSVVTEKEDRVDREGWDDNDIAKVIWRRRRSL